MKSILKPFIALYAAMLLISAALCLLATFLSLRLTIEGFSIILFHDLYSIGRTPISMAFGRIFRPVRSIVIPVLGGLFALISVLMMIAAAHGSLWFLIAATSLFGGIMFTIYPSAVARAHDMFEPKDVVNVSSALLLFNGIGAVIGPIASSTAIEWLDSPYGFYIYFFGAGVIYAASSFLLRQREKHQILPVEEQVDFMIMNHTSQIVMHMDPRSEVDKTDSKPGN